MDKEIRHIEREVKGISKAHHGKHNEKKMQKNLGKVSRELKHLEKEDIKHDRLIERAKKKLKTKKR